MFDDDPGIMSEAETSSTRSLQQPNILSSALGPSSSPTLILISA
jgi:hypothetical protein